MPSYTKKNYVSSKRKKKDQNTVAIEELFKRVERLENSISILIRLLEETKLQRLPTIHETKTFEETQKKRKPSCVIS